jgi:hypothetical protein
MKKGILLIAVMLSIAGLVQAQEGELSGTIDLTYMTSYIWRGFDYYADDHSAYQASVDLDLYGTGLGVKVIHRRAISAPFENAEGLDVALYYGDSAYQGETYITNYTVGWVYYGFPDEPRSGSTDAAAQAADMQEFFASFSWPEICPAGFVPSYTVLTMWPSEGNSQARKNTGWAHVLGIGYDLNVPGMTPETPEQTLHLSAELVYNDGVGPGVVIGNASGTVDHDWSHAVFGVSTDFDLGDNLIFTPAAYYQSSMDDSVNSQDEAWLSLSMKYMF